MLEIRDFAFRLFGMTIPITGNDVADRMCDFDESSSCSNDHRLEKDLAEDDSMETDINCQLDDPSPHSESDENQKESNTKKDTESPKDSDDESQQKSPLKKPDKILPCPRCKSMDTKFCYYNNYNVNQPRHFCKGCQRYWTAGGTMRNVPVGAGRRKNKGSTSSSQYYHITMSEAITTESSSSCSGLKTHAMVLTFGSENHSSILNPAEKKGSNVGGLKSINEPDKRDLNGYVNQVPCFLLPSGYPMPFYPAPYWNGGIPYNVPLISALSPSSNFDSSLGKRSRDGEMLKPCENERSTGTNNTNVLVPKTLRIDDPSEAAKSSIWTTLGIKNDDNNKGYPLSKGGFFNSFKSAKGEAKDQKRGTSQCLTANPAAFCRSINFQESLS